MKVYRVQHYNYNPNSKKTHKLLLNTLNYYLDKYPCPNDISIFNTSTRSCFKTLKLAQEFLKDIEYYYYETWDDDIEIDQRPEMYELLEYEIDEMDIVYTDNFQVIHSIKEGVLNYNNLKNHLIVK